MSFIRWALGRIILFFDWLFTPKGIKRTTEDQVRVDALMANLTLYEYAACPFCVKVRRAMKRSSINVTRLDAKRSEVAKQELLAGGGALQVPCLKIVHEQDGVQWMYESSDIIAYLHKRLSSQGFAF